MASLLQFAEEKSSPSKKSKKNKSGFIFSSICSKNEINSKDRGYYHENRLHLQTESVESIALSRPKLGNEDTQRTDRGAIIVIEDSPKAKKRAADVPIAKSKKEQLNII